MAGRTDELQKHRPKRRDVLLWVTVLAGPLAWALTEQASYALAPTACFLGRPLLLYLVPLSTLLIVVPAAFLARRLWQKEPPGPPEKTEKGEPEESRSRFMALAGFWLCIGFALAILATGMPPLLLRVCQ